MIYLRNYIENIENILPVEIIKKYDFIDRKEAFLKIHFPFSKNDIEIAKYLLAYEELFEVNYKSISKKTDIFNQTE
jgi:ATP-dependent DNA helicase RecG